MQVKIPTISTALLIFLGALTTMTATQPSYGIEKPDFEVVFSDEEIEYRRYQPYLIATTTVENTEGYSKAANTGFRRLFDYISGANTDNAEVSMTAPVRQQKETKISMTAPVQQIQTTQGWEIAFMLPSKFSLESAPRPTSNKIEIKRVPSRLMAVIRYSGRWTEKNFEEQKAKLRQAVERSGIEIVSSAESAVYNPPFMPPFMRRNEVMFEVSSFPTQ